MSAAWVLNRIRYPENGTEIFFSGQFVDQGQELLNFAIGLIDIILRLNLR